MYLEISNPMDYHAALYIRLSKEDESEGPSQSVQNQESLLREFVQQHRLSVYDTYVDDGWSGTNFDRPDFQRMIADIEAKKVNMVITKDLSRLGRDYIMTGHYMERYFPEHRVRYISLLDGIDTGVDSTANDITPFRAIMNDMYAKDISKKIKSVKRDKQRKGQFIGGKPVYGYKMHPTEKNKIVIDEEVAPVVRRIFALALSGMSCRNIAALLNQEGVPTPATYAGSPGGKTRPLHRPVEQRADLRHAAKRDLHRQHGAGAQREDQLQVQEVPAAGPGQLGGGGGHPRASGGPRRPSARCGCW